MKSNDKFIKVTNHEVASFFGMPIIKPDVVIYNSRSEFVESWSARNSGKDCPEWLVASTTFDGVIHIMAADIMPGTSKISGLDRYKKVVKHELAHLYTDTLNKDTPAWLSEGISCYVADQVYYKKYNQFDITLDLLNSFTKWGHDSGVYGVGRAMVDIIVEGSSQNHLIDLIRMNDVGRTKWLKSKFDWLK